MSDFDGFAPIESIFYTVFHPTEGTKVSQQVPLGSIVPSAKSSTDAYSEQLFDFDLIKNYIIPKSPLCDRLITFKIGQYRVVGYPVSITAPYYARNSFSFNFCFVFKYDRDTTTYESSIKRLGRMFKNLEEQYQILSKKENDKVYYKNIIPVINPEISNATNALDNDDYSGTRSVSMDSTYINMSSSTTMASYSRIFSDLENDTNPSTPIGISTKQGNLRKLDSIESLIQQIFQDLNNYSECLIPVDSGNSVDIKLLPILPPPLRINPEDVPISTVNLRNLVDVNWDPTMLKILPYIDGINCIQKISTLANADYSVVKSCIQHLMYYKCIIITDIFQFQNIYAPTSNIDLFLKDNHMAAECQAYVVTPTIFKNLPFDKELKLNNKSVKIQDSTETSKSTTNITSSYASLLGTSSSKLKKESVTLPSKAKLFYLYRSLHQGQTVKHWYKDHATELTYIDVRRFISFGVLRGLIYRVKSYPIIDSIIQHETPWTDFFNQQGSYDANTSNTGFGFGFERRKYSNNSIGDTKQRKQINELIKHLKDVKSFDAICTEMELDKKSVDSLLRRIGHYNVINS